VFFLRKRIGTVDELLQIEEWFGTNNKRTLRSRYNKALAALESEDVEEWLADASNAGLTGDSAARFRNDWMGGDRIPGLASPEVKARLQRGFIDAITDARDNDRKLSILFALGGAGELEMDHVVGFNAVTVVISVPIEAADTSQRLSD
jgi:hypothetical protein